LTDPGATFSLCIDQSVQNVGRGNVYLKPLSNSIIDPNGVWEADFKYTSKWLMNLSEYDFDRVWLGLTISSLIITPDDFIGGDPLITYNELLSATVSFGTSLETFAQNLETSINNNSVNSGWEVYGWTLSHTPGIIDYENSNINTTSMPLSITFSVLSMIIETSNPTSSYFNNQVLSDYGSGYTFPPYGILGTPSFSGLDLWYITQNGLETTTYSLPCIYDIVNNDLLEVRDSDGNVWRGSPEFFIVGISSIFDYPIYSPGRLLSQFTNCVIDSCFINAYDFIGSYAQGCNLKNIILGPNALLGPSITNCNLYGNFQGGPIDEPSKIMDSSISNITSQFTDYDASVICDSVITNGFDAKRTIVMSSNVFAPNFRDDFAIINNLNILTLDFTIIRDNISISDFNFLRSTPNFDFDVMGYGKTFSLIKSDQSGFFQIGYQTPFTATASSDIGVSFYLIQEYPGFTSSLLFTTSVATFSQINFSDSFMIPNLMFSGLYWSVLMAFDTDVSVDKIQFTADGITVIQNHDLGIFNVYIKKL